MWGTPAPQGSVSPASPCRLPVGVTKTFFWCPRRQHALEEREHLCAAPELTAGTGPALPSATPGSRGSEIGPNFIPPPVKGSRGGSGSVLQRHPLLFNLRASPFQPPAGLGWLPQGTRMSKKCSRVSCSSRCHQEASRNLSDTDSLCSYCEAQLVEQKPDKTLR